MARLLHPQDPLDPAHNLMNEYRDSNRGKYQQSDQLRENDKKERALDEESLSSTKIWERKKKNLQVINCANACAWGGV